MPSFRAIFVLVGWSGRPHIPFSLKNQIRGKSSGLTRNHSLGGQEDYSREPHSLVVMARAERKRAKKMTTRSMNWKERFPSAKSPSTGENKKALSTILPLSLRVTLAYELEIRFTSCICANIRIFVRTPRKYSHYSFARCECKYSPNPVLGMAWSAFGGHVSRIDTPRIDTQGSSITILFL